MLDHHKPHECEALCPACEIAPFVRNHYFTGKLLLERDFTDEQRYFIEKLRHHHQRLHGWGVACGLKVKQHENPACRGHYFCIEPGTAIDCCGHEILVREEECIDITQLPSIKALIDKKDENRHVVQICLRYRECATEEIPVLYDECGCDDTKCAPNRVLESYDIDVILDPKVDATPQHTPKLQWVHTINISHAARVALNDATHRIYVLPADGAGSIYQISTDNHATITSQNLSAKGVVVAVSNNGERVYVAAEPVDPNNPRQLLVLNATQPGLPSINTNLIGIPNSGNSNVLLAVAPDNRLLALVTATGDVLRWDTDIDTQPAPAAPTVVKPLGAGLTCFALSNDGQKAYAAGASNEIQQLDIAAQTVVKITVLPAGASVSALAVVKSSEPDVLAIADQNGNRLHLVAPEPAALVGSVTLDHAPIALAASRGGQWAYVLEQDAAGSFIQAVNIHRIQLKLSPVVGMPFKVGDSSQQIIISDSGAHLYVPFTDDLTKPAVGGVAVLDVSEQACEEILWRHLDGCPHCDMPNCVVLATLEHYQVGDKIEDQTDPPADPVADMAAHTARLDNRRGRELLPSTQVLKELIDCFVQQGPGGQGQQGPQGDPGPAGPGLERGLTRVEALSWSHNEVHPTVGGTPSFLVPIRREAVEFLGIVVGFTDNVQITAANNAGHVFQVLVDTTTSQNRESGIVCRCAVRGTVIPVDLKVDVQGRIVRNAEGRIDTAQEVTPGSQYGRGLAFLFESTPIGKRIVSGMVPELWVILRGDFIVDTLGRAIDAEFVRAELPTGDRPKPPTGQPLSDQLGIQGGTFESWFSVKRG